MMASTARSHDDSENDSLEGNFLFHEEEEEEDPIAALRRIKQFISDRDIPKGGEYESSSDDESEASAIHKGILSFLEGKENDLTPKVSVQFVSPRAGPEGITPAARKTPTSTKNRTPLGARDLGNKTVFSFDEAEYTPPPASQTTFDEAKYTPLPPTSQMTNINMLLCETPKHCQLSPDIKIASPPKKNDPYRWAYEVWRQYELMGRRAGETSSTRKVRVMPDAGADACFKTPSPRCFSGSALDTSDWDLSSIDSALKVRNSSITKGADRAKEFARQSTGNFQTVLSSWKKGRSDTSNIKRERENAMRRAPENFQDLLRSWRDARLEMMDDGQKRMDDGQKRAVTYAREASTNLDELMTTWQDKQTAEFEDWALEYARSPEEFQDLLRKWRQAPSDNQTGQERALEYAREANGNVDHIMMQWRQSHANEFEDWAREQAHSTEELHEILRQWRNTKHCGEPEEVDVLEQGDEPGHGTASEQDQAAAERSASNFDNIKGMWRKSEVPSFQDWAESHARSPAELQDMLRMWREGKPECGAKGQEFEGEDTGEFSETLAKWRQSQFPDFTDWAWDNSKSNEEYQLLLQKWHAEQQTTVAVDELSNRSFAKVPSKGSSHNNLNMEEWVQEKSVSSQAFQDLLRRWRQEKPEFPTSTHVDETQSGPTDSDMESWIKWKSVSSPESPPDYQAMLSLWEEAKLELSQNKEAHRASENSSTENQTTVGEASNGNFAKVLSMWNTHNSPNMEEWVEQKSVSSQAFKDLLRRWRAEKPEFASSEQLLTHVDETQSEPNDFIMESWIKQKAVSTPELPPDYQAMLNLWEEAKRELSQNKEIHLANEDSSVADQTAVAPVDEVSNENFAKVLSKWSTHERSNMEEWAQEKSSSSQTFQDLLRRWRQEKPEFASSEQILDEMQGGPTDSTMESWVNQKAASSPESPPDYQAMLGLWEDAKRELSQNREADQSSENASAKNQTAIAPVGEALNGNFAKVLSKWSTRSSPNMEEWAKEKSSSSQSFQDLLQRWREEKHEFTTREQIRTEVEFREGTDGNGLTETKLESDDSNSMEHWAKQKAESSPELPPDYRAILNLWDEAKRELSLDKEAHWASENTSGEGSTTAASAGESSNGNVAKVISKWRTYNGPNIEEWAQEKSLSSQEFQELLGRWREEKPEFVTNEQTLTQNVVQLESKEDSGMDGVPVTKLERNDSNMERWVTQNAESSHESSVDYQAILKLWEEAKLQLSQDSEARNRTSSAKFEKILVKWQESGIPRFEDWAKQNTRSPDELQSLLRKRRVSKPTFVAHELPADKCDADCFFDSLMTSWEDAKIDSSVGKKRSKTHVRHSTGSYQNLVSSWKDSSSYLDAVEEQSVVDDESISVRSRASVSFAPDVQLGVRRSRISNALSDDCAQVYFESLLNMSREDEPKKNEEVREDESLPGKIEEHRQPHEDLPGKAEGQDDENLPEKAKEQNQEDIPAPEKVEEEEEEEGSIGTPATQTGSQRAAEFAQDANGDFDNLMNAWREPKYNTPDGSERAQECSRHSTGKFQNLMASWKEQPTHLEGVKGDSTQLLTPTVGLIDSSVPNEGLIVDTTESRVLSCVDGFEDKSTPETANSANGKTGNFDGLMKRWKEAKPEVQTGEHRAAEFARDANDNFESIRTNWVETNHDTPSETICGQGGMKQQAGREQLDIVSSDHIVEEGTLVDAEERKGTDSTCHKSENFDGLVNQWKTAKPVVQTGAQRAAEFARDATGNFDDIRTNFLETPKGMGPADDKACPSTGKQRAVDFARDATGNFADIRTTFVEKDRETPKGAGPSRENAVMSTGKQRAQEFARASNLELQSLLAKFNNKEYSSLEASSSTAETGKTRSMPSSTPITALIAALASGHTPLLGASSSVDDSEDIGSLFDDSDIEVASTCIPEGEDPIVAPNGHLRTCACASSLFSGNDKLVEFFLPQLGMACTCGKDVEIVPNPDVTDPTSIELILRPWQCEFLKSFGIHRGDQLVKAHHRSASILAKAMKKWRKKRDLPRARTVSCGLALHIWSKTCKFEVRAVRRQIAMGVEVIKPPNAVSVLSHLLAPQEERRVSVPHTGRRRRSPKELVEVESQAEM
jgi:hypothetical protein